MCGIFLFYATLACFSGSVTAKLAADDAKLSGNEHIGQEVTSEAFYKAIHSIDGFRVDCDMRVWLCQIAKNTYFAYLKKSKRN